MLKTLYECELLASGLVSETSAPFKSPSITRRCLYYPQSPLEAGTRRDCSVPILAPGIARRRMSIAIMPMTKVIKSKKIHRKRNIRLTGFEINF